MELRLARGRFKSRSGRVHQSLFGAWYGPSPSPTNPTTLDSSMPHCTRVTVYFIATNRLGHFTKNKYEQSWVSWYLKRLYSHRRRLSVSGTAQNQRLLPCRITTQSTACVPLPDPCKSRGSTDGSSKTDVERRAISRIFFPWERLGRVRR